MQVKVPPTQIEPGLAGSMPVQLHEFSTSASGRGRALEDWNDRISNSFTGLTSDPADPGHFGAHLKHAAFGDIVLGVPQASRSIVRHTRTHVATALADSFLLHVQIAGASLNEQRGRSAALLPGDFTLCSSLDPYSVQVHSDSRLLVLRLSNERLRRLVPDAEDLVCVPIRGARGGIPAIMVEYLSAIWRQMECGILDRIPTELTDSMLQVVAAGLQFDRAPPAARRSRSSLRRQQLLSYVRSRIHDPNLTVSGVANALGMSARNVAKLMCAEGVGLAAFILEQRLKGAAHWLIEPRYAHLTITQIAYGWGFGDLSHFHRAFRMRFGQSPGHYRCERTASLPGEEGR
jgi:AraC family transcriptional regulator, positive regulator of tynA and feaB